MKTREVKKRVYADPEMVDRPEVDVMLQTAVLDLD
jgi:hypothetical protein